MLIVDRIEVCDRCLLFGLRVSRSLDVSFGRLITRS